MQKAQKEVEKEGDRPDKKKAAARKQAVGAAAGLIGKVIRMGKVNVPKVVSELLFYMNSHNPFVRNHMGPEAMQRLTELLGASRANRQAIAAANERPQLSNGRSQWKDLMETAVAMSEDPPEGLSPQRMVAFLHAIALHGPVHVRVPMEMVRKQLKIVRGMLCKGFDADGTVTGEVNSGVVANLLLKTANVIMRQAAYQCPREICEFGEKCAVPVLYQYDRRRREGDEANRLVVEFFTLQMCLHHPRGAATTVEGACYGNEAVWTNRLQKLYANLVDATITGKLKNLRTKKDAGGGGGIDIFSLDADSTRLFAALTHQLVSRAEGGSGEGGARFAVTQIAPADATQMSGSGSGDGESAAKRRRLLVSADLNGFLDNVRKGGCADRMEQREAVPWLQILSEMLDKYPSWLASRSDLFSSVFKCVVSALQGCRLVAVKSLLISCCDKLLQIEDLMTDRMAENETGRADYFLPSMLR